MIYVTGDTHGGTLRVQHFCEMNHTTVDDILIILGDVCVNYYKTISDMILKEKLSRLPITLFCIHGNHEDRPQNLSSYISKPFGDNGETVYYEPDFPNLLFAVDNGLYEFGGKRFYVMGGAYSVDKYYSLSRNKPWFADEQPSEELKADALKDILKFNEWYNGVDYVLTHTCPLKYEPTEAFLEFIDQSKVDKSTEIFLQEIENKLVYSNWLCGHYHIDKIKDKIRFFFNDVEKLEDI